MPSPVDPAGNHESSTEGADSCLHGLLGLGVRLRHGLELWFRTIPGRAFVSHLSVQMDFHNTIGDENSSLRKVPDAL